MNFNLKEGEKERNQLMESLSIYDITDTGEIPSPRSSSVCFTYNGKFYVFGGIGLVQFYNDLFCLSLDVFEWTRIQPSTTFAPPARGGACSGVVADHFLFLFGGRTEYGVMGDSYLYNLQNNAWMEYTSTMAASVTPCAREDAALLIYNGNEVVLYGGTNSSGEVLSDMWVLNIERRVWSCVMQIGEGPSNGLAAMSARVIHGKGSSQAVIYGGFDGASYKNDLYLLDMSTYTWARLRFTGTIPRPRTHSALEVMVNGDCLMFGGYSGAVALNDCWVVPLDANSVSRSAFRTWCPIKDNSSIGSSEGQRFKRASPVSCRGAASSCIFGNLMLMFGGCNGTHFLSSVTAISVDGKESLFSRRVTSPNLEEARRYKKKRSEQVVPLESPFDNSSNLSIHSAMLEAQRHPILSSNTASNAVNSSMVGKQRSSKWTNHQHKEDETSQNIMLPISNTKIEEANDELANAMAKLRGEVMEKPPSTSSSQFPNQVEMMSVSSATQVSILKEENEYLRLENEALRKQIDVLNRRMTSMEQHFLPVEEESRGGGSETTTIRDFV